MTKRTQLINLYSQREYEEYRGSINKENKQHLESLVGRVKGTLRLRYRLTATGVDVLRGYMNLNFPNFHAATEVIFKQMKLTALSNSKGVYFKPILLAGPAGIGKTQYAQTLSELLKLPFRKIDMGNVTGAMVLTGLSYKWSSGSPGHVAATLLANKVANPIIFLDELDKGQPMFSNGGNVQAALLTLLESTSAAEFRDEFLGFKMDASHVNYIATCNDTKMINPYLLSRFTVVEASDPTPEQLMVIAPQVFRGIVQELELDDYIPQVLDKRVLNELSALGVSVRELRGLLTEALSSSIEGGAKKVTPIALREVVKRKAKVSLQSAPRPIGFIH